MVSRLIGRIPERLREVLVTSLIPEGIIQLTNLLMEEQEQMKKFALDYPTASLRRLAAKQIKSKTTPAEYAELESAIKIFVGNLMNGDHLANPKSLELVNSIRVVVSKLNSFVYNLAQATHCGNSADIMILGERLTAINLNPRGFTQLVYDNYFTQPQWVFEQIRWLIEIRQTSEMILVFKDTKVLEEELIKVGIDEVRIEEIVNLMSELKVDSTKDITQIGQAVRRLLIASIDLDNTFNVEVYKEVKNYLPQYHKVNLDWSLWFLTSYIGSYKPYVSAAISDEVLLALYRKGVELTCQE